MLDAQRETTEAADWVHVDVTDTGIGMTPEQAAAVFEAFSQADGSTTRRHGGMGIGLAISKQLCEKMNGELSLRSELGKGSCFTIRIPAQALDTTGTLA